MKNDSPSETLETPSEENPSAPVNNIASQSDAETPSASHPVEIQYIRLRDLFREMYELAKNDLPEGKDSRLTTLMEEVDRGYIEFKENGFSGSEDDIANLTQWADEAEEEITKIKADAWVSSSQKAVEISARVNEAFNDAISACNNYYDLRDNFPYNGTSKKDSILQNLHEKNNRVKCGQAITYTGVNQIILELNEITRELEQKTLTLKQKLLQAQSIERSAPTLEVKVHAIEDMTLADLKSEFDRLDRTLPFHDDEGMDPAYSPHMERMNAISNRLIAADIKTRTQLKEQKEIDKAVLQIQQMEVKARLSLLDTIRQKHSVAMEFINNLDEALLNKKEFETTLNNMVESATELAKTAIAFPDLNLSENDILGALNSFVTDLEHQPRAMVMHMPVKGAEEKTVLPMPPTVGKTTETSETEVVRREPSAFPPSISIPKLSTSSSSLFGGSSSNSTAANTPDLPRKPLLSTILEPSDSDDEFSISDPTEQGNNAAGKTPPPSPPNTPSNKSFRI